MVPTAVDVAVVGGRVAGCVAASLLADAGHSVLVVDRAPLPSPTLSTHFFRGGGLGAVLQRLGLVEQVRALLCPPLTRQWTSVHGGTPEEAAAQDPGTLGYALAVRRESIDPVLAGRARRAGAVVADRSRVVGLLRDGGRVCGIEIGGPERETVRVKARLVIGADGRHSRIARCVDAEVEEYEPGHRGLFYSYVTGWRAPTGGDHIDAAEFSLGDDEMAYVFPSDGGVTCLALTVSAADAAWLRGDLQRRFYDRLASHAALWPRIENSTVSGPVLGAGPEDNVVRTATGPGWALVGDAGQHQDPWSGVGMDTASIHAAALADAYSPWLARTRSEEEAAAAYRRTRDGDGRAIWRATVEGSRRISV